MDMNQFRKSLAKRQKLHESHPEIKNLAYEIQNAHKSPSLRKMAERVESVLGHVISMASKDPFTFNRKTPHLISRLDTLMRMLYSGVHVGVDPSEVEILQKEIVADIKKH